MTVQVDLVRRLKHRRRIMGQAFQGLSQGALLMGLLFLALLVAGLLWVGLPWLDWQFITSYPSSLFPEQSGILSALFGSLVMAGLTALLAFPIGVAAAIYLEEYASDNWLTKVLQVNIANLAGVPSVLYGILGYTLFIRHLGRSCLAGALALALLILPVTIIAAREALRAVPDSIRQAAYAVGATRWQVIRHHVLLYALPGILTGTILAMARALGETAPLIALGALVVVRFIDCSFFTVLPIQIWNWASQPDPAYRALAAAASLVLLILVLMLNALAIFLRHKLQRRW